MSPYWIQDLEGGSGSGANPQVPGGTVNGTNTSFTYTGALNNLFEWESESIGVHRGETILVPASIENFTLKPTAGIPAKLLEVYVE